MVVFDGVCWKMKQNAAESDNGNLKIDIENIGDTDRSLLRSFKSYHSTIFYKQTAPTAPKNKLNNIILQIHNLKFQLQRSDLFVDKFITDEINIAIGNR